MVGGAVTINGASGNGAIPLLRTPGGWEVWKALLNLRLTPAARKVIQDYKNKEPWDYQENEDTESVETDTKTQYQIIHEAIFVALQNETDLLADMLQNCDANNGAQQFVWLEDELVGSSVSKSVGIVYKLVQFKIGNVSAVTDVKTMISDNKQLPTPFPDDLLVMLILGKLPEHYGTLKTVILERNRLPSPSDLVKKMTLTVTNADIPVTLSEPKLVFSATGSSQHLTCFNCGVPGHRGVECDKAKADCDICGAAAGHLPRFCLARNSKPYPEHWSAEKKAWMDNQRKIVKAAKKEVNAMALQVTKTEDFRSLNFEQIREMEDLNIF